MQGDEVVAQKRSPPLALAACDEDGFTRLVGERIKSTLHREVTGAPLSPTRTRIGQDIGPHSSPVGSCGCAHDRRSTASRACTMAATSLATSGRDTSSRAKFEAIQSTHSCSLPRQCRNFVLEVDPSRWRKYSVQQSRFASTLHHLSKNCGVRRTAARQVKARRISSTVPEPKSKMKIAGHLMSG